MRWLRERRRARALARNNARLLAATVEWSHGRIRWEDMPWELRGSVHHWTPDGDTITRSHP